MILTKAYDPEIECLNCESEAPVCGLCYNQFLDDDKIYCDGGQDHYCIECGEQT